MPIEAFVAYLAFAPRCARRRPPQKPALAEFTIELMHGWWLGTSIANRDRMRIIRKACYMERLKLGKDIVITLPNAV